MAGFGCLPGHQIPAALPVTPVLLACMRPSPTDKALWFEQRSAQADGVAV